MTLPSSGLDELRERLADLEEAAEAVERQIEACETRGESLRLLEEMRAFYVGNGSFWEGIKPLDEWTQLSTPEGEWKVRVPFDDQVEHMRNVARQTRLEALAKHTPEQRRERYRELGLRVVAHSREEIEVSGLFDPERIYIPASSSTSPPSQNALRTVRPTGFYTRILEATRGRRQPLRAVW